MEKHKPFSRAKLLEMKALELSSRIQAAKSKKQTLLETRAQVQVAKIRKRQYTRDLRLMKEDRVAVRRNWSRVVAILGLCSVSLFAIPNRMKLHERAAHLVRNLCLISIALGKFMRPVRVIRRKKALGKLTIMGFYARLWLKNKNRRRTKIIVDTLEKGITQGLIVKLMDAWRSKLLRIQRGMRWLLLWKRIRYRRLARRWVVYEQRSRKLQIPFEVKMIFLRQLVKKRLLDHIAEMREWKEDCLAERKHYEDNYYSLKTDQVLTGSQRRMTLILPQRPAFNPIVRQKDFEQMCEAADRSRLRWDWMVHRSNVASRLRFVK